MRVSKEESSENREALLRAASRLFRKRGIDDVGVAEIAKAAGLTHGALYAHFPSKDALAAEAFSFGFTGSMARLESEARASGSSFDGYLEQLFSTEMRDHLETGCPLAASACEVARQDAAVRAQFTRAFEEMVSALERSLEREMPSPDRRRLAVASIAAQIGAIAVSRAVSAHEPVLAQEVLEATRSTLRAAHRAPPRGSKARRSARPPRKKSGPSPR